MTGYDVIKILSRYYCCVCIDKITCMFAMNFSAESASNVTSPNDTYESPFDSTGIAVSATILITFLVVGVVGNTLTIAVIVSYKQLSNNVFMRFILSLCVSDLISALISWLYLYRRTWGFDDWSPLPDVFCKFYWAADIMTSYVTAYHIFGFAIIRFLSIRFPLVYKKITLKVCWIILTSLWIICFCCGFIPFWIFNGSRKPQRHLDREDSRWPACTIIREQFEMYKNYQHLAYPIFLYFPTAGVVFVCCLTIYLVISRSHIQVGNASNLKKSRSKEKRAVRQLLLIIFSFLLGYIPFIAYEFWSVQKHPSTRYYALMDYWFGTVEYFFLRFSECLNPLFYNLGSAKVRKYTREFLKKIWCKRDVPANNVPERSRTSSIWHMSKFGV